MTNGVFGCAMQIEFSCFDVRSENGFKNMICMTILYLLLTVVCFSQAIRALFPSDCNPFYAGFGNRDTDEISYLKVGIPKGKIFIINPQVTSTPIEVSSIWLYG